MWFLIKSTLLMSLALLVLPVEPAKLPENYESTGPLQAAYAAKGAWQDVSSLCDRQPEVCEIGRAAATTIAVRARESARIAFEFLDTHLADEELPSKGKNPE